MLKIVIVNLCLGVTLNGAYALSWMILFSVLGDNKACYNEISADPMDSDERWIFTGQGLTWLILIKPDF